MRTCPILPVNPLRLDSSNADQIAGCASIKAPAKLLLSKRPSSARLGSARLGSARLGSARLGSDNMRTCPILPVNPLRLDSSNADQTAGCACIKKSAGLLLSKRPRSIPSATNLAAGGFGETRQRRSSPSESRVPDYARQVATPRTRVVSQFDIPPGVPGAYARAFQGSESQTEAPPELGFECSASQSARRASKARPPTDSPPRQPPDLGRDVPPQVLGAHGATLLDMDISPELFAIVGAAIALAALIIRSTSRTDQRIDRFEDAMAAHRTAVDADRQAERAAVDANRQADRAAADADRQADRDAADAARQAERDAAEADRRAFQAAADADRRAFQAAADADRRAFQAAMDDFRKEMQRLAERQVRVESAAAD